MAVGAVQKNDTNKSGRANYLKFAAVGGLTGYALKYLIPVTSSEKNDENYKNELKKMQADADLTASNEIAAMRKFDKKTIIEDTFLKLHDAKTLNVTEINKLGQPLATQVSELYARVFDISEYLIDIRTKALTAYTKKIRSSFSFVAIGVVASVAGAIVHNISQANSKKKAQKSSK